MQDKNFIKPYGDTLNDGKIQISFTLPLDAGAKAQAAASQIMEKLGLEDIVIAQEQSLSPGFTFYVAYGSFKAAIDLDTIVVLENEQKALTIEETDELIKRELGRKLTVIGASTGTDAHTVGIDAIMNRKGFNGRFGLERYDMLITHNLGSQVLNETLLQKAVQENADVILVSQTVTQKDIHIHNLTELIEMAEAEGLRDKMVFICGGARITHELAKELGYDAGFGSGKYADDVATFMVKELIRRKESNF
ncbi:MAG: hypothetical protein GX138_02170 [Firmicutes bacterium]|jgi:beta-lysine 5,6-aminomutase beta subunit|nr:hypothetical protein [Bacillota bacterium]